MKYTYKQLMKASKHMNDDRPLLCSLAVLGDCSTQMIVTAIKGYMGFEGYGLSVYEADYDQIELQLRDPDSGFHHFQADYIFLCMTTKKLYDKYCEAGDEERTAFASMTLERIRGYWDCVTQGQILFPVFPEFDDRVYGNFAGKVEKSFLYQLRKLNVWLMEEAGKRKNVYLLELPYLQSRLGISAMQDDKLYYVAKLPYSLRAIPEIVKNICDIMLSLKGRVKKCVILDLDGTIWGGVIGEDGLQGIEIGELGTGRAFTDFQRWLKELKKRGILLAVCSKNEETKAKEPFLMHPDMVLRLEDISVFVANWDDKASNIRKIQQTLNLGLDSFVFLDDNSFERNLARELLPELTVPELPEDPALYVSFLQQENLFETVSYSEEDSKRTELYQVEQKRSKMQSLSKSFDDYLKNLEMKAEWEQFVDFYFPRIAQLSQRSNQFNLRTVRYTEEEIAKMAGDPEYITRYVTLKDRFGEYGLISVVILKRKASETLFVDTWLMSCRVLKRGVEEYVLNHMVKTAKEAGCRYLEGEYIPTSKNSMVKDIYEKNGFEKTGENQYRADVENWKERKTYIADCQQLLF